MAASRRRTLCAFDKVYLEPGEEKTVTLAIPRENLCQWDAGMRLSIRYLPKTIAMVFLHILPLLLALFLPNMLVFTLPFWMFFGLGFFAQSDAFLLRPVFEMLERPQPEPQEGREPR